MAKFEEEILIKINVAKEQAKRAFDEIKENGEKLASGVAKAAKIASVALIAMGAAFVVAMKKSVSAAAELEEEMANVSTLVDTARVDMSKFQEGILGMSMSTLKSTTDLTRGLYQVISAGISDASDSLDVLEVAAKAATAGITDTKVAVDVITTVLNAYGKSASEAGKVSDILFQTVKQGKTEFGALASSLGKTIPIAATLGIELEEVSAVVATLTKGGFATSEAVTALKATLVAIAKPTDDARKVAGELGIEWGAAALESKNLIEFFGDLAVASGGNVEVLGKLIPQVEALNAVLALTGKQSDELTSIYKEMGNSFGVTEEAFEKQAKTLNAELKKLKLSFEELKIIIGNELLPTMKEYIKQATAWVKIHKIDIKNAVMDTINVLGSFAKWIWDTATAIGQWIKENKELLVSLGEFVVLVGITSKVLSFVAALKLLGPAIVAVKAAIVSGGLMAGLVAMGPLLAAIAAAAALVVGYKLGKYFLEWANGTDKAEASTQKHTLALEAHKQKLAEAAAVAERNRIAIAKNKQTWLEATQEVEKNTTAQKVNIKEIEALIEAHEKAGQTAFESIEKQRQAALKLAGDLPQYKKTINEMFDEMRLQAAKEAFDILDVEEFDQQARNIVEGFKEITDGYDLTMSELEALTQKAFDQIKEAADRGELPIGFDVNRVEENVNEAMAKLKEGMQKTTVAITEEGDKTTIALTGQTLTVKEAVANTITALNELLLTSVTEESRALSLREQAVDNYVLFVAGAEVDITEFTRGELATRSQLVTNYAEHSISEYNRIVAAFQASQTNLAPLASPGEFTGYTGQFHNGTPFVPSTGNYLLEKGEAIIPANQNDNRSFDNRKSVEVVMTNNFYGDNGYDQANTLRQMLSTEGAL
jgi:TP901 family phage tail tape measure protein